MDITKTVEPRSDQLNYDDVQTHPMTITVESVKQGPPDQPVELHNVEHPGRPYKPGKSMRRVLIAAWGTDAAKYVGRSIELYGDPTIKFGKDAVGGIRIKALSDITEPLTVSLTVTRGKRAPFVVQPLVVEPQRDESGRDWLVELADADGDADAIAALGAAAKAAHASSTVLTVLRKAFHDAKESTNE